jgi:plasmid replication initiation protein
MTKKNVDPIISLGKDEDKLLVQKSIPLFALWQSDLTLAEFKILDTYLARIDSHKPERRAVMFEKGEIEELFGVKKINIQDLQIRLKHLMGNVIEIPDKNAKKGFEFVTLFEYAEAVQDDYGCWQLNLECTQKAMKYFFNIEHIGYLRYKLRCITSLTSRYTYIMFIYLELNRFRKKWNVDLEVLKHILHCESEELYKQFKFFNQKILKKTQQEMLEKTECRYTYTPIKKGRTVVAVHFELESLSKNILEEDDDQITIEQWQEAVEEKRQHELWQEPLESFDLTEEQYKAIEALLVTIPSTKLPESPAWHDDIDLNRYHYIEQKVTEIKARGNIKSPYNYLIKIMKNDTK